MSSALDAPAIAPVVTAPAPAPPAVPAPPSRPGRRRAGRMTATLVVSLLVFMLGGNLVVFAATLIARSTTTAQTPLHLEGVKNGRIVDAGLWRGGAPSSDGYQSLAEAGVTTVVDLRGEHDIVVDEDRLAALGITRVHIPIRDGQRPTSTQLEQFMDLMASSPGLVYVHCGAGVGRTGSVVAAYRVLTGQADGRQAVRDNLAVGPPSLEQLSYAAMATADGPGTPNVVLVGASRLLDGPRRLLSYL